MIYNLTGWPADLAMLEAGVVDLPDNQGKYIAKLLEFPELPTQIDLAATAKLIAEFCVAKLSKDARVLIGGPNFLMHWLEVELCAEGFRPCHGFFRPADFVDYEFCGLVEVL